MNIRLNIENNVASSLAARKVQVVQVLDYKLCAFMACRGTNLPYTASLLQYEPVGPYLKMLSPSILQLPRGR